MPKTIELNLPALPDLTKVGSNKTYAHHMQGARLKGQEKDKWRLLLAEQGFGLRSDAEGPLLAGKVQCSVTLYYPDNRLPDEHNCQEAVKVLLDLLQVNRVHRVSGNSWRQTGYCGIIDNDRDLVWEEPPRLIVDRDKAPMTLITLTEE